MAAKREVTRVTNKITGAQKEQKLAQPSLIPYKALMQIAEVYGFGASKYSRFNWRSGYDFNLSIDALMRHLGAWIEGEDSDPESGLSHLAHGGWHILTLLTLMDEHPELDNRWKGDSHSIH